MKCGLNTVINDFKWFEAQQHRCNCEGGEMRRNVTDKFTLDQHHVGQQTFPAAIIQIWLKQFGDTSGLSKCMCLSLPVKSGSDPLFFNEPGKKEPNLKCIELPL